MPSSPARSLYCSENADEATSWTRPSQISSDPRAQTAHLRRPISLLLAAELDHSPSPDYLPRLRNRSPDPTARQDAVLWILKVHGYYGFRPATASLAVSYLDRFLSCNELPSCGEGWPLQLLSVACVSVAAKMEETVVPFLLDLQVMEPRFVFDPRTVQRMELLLMSALQWRMCSVTPFDFIDAIWREGSDGCGGGGGGGGDGSGGRVGELLSRASDLIIATYRVIDFLEFRPSTISAAAIVCAAGQTGDLSPEDTAFFSTFPEELDIDSVKRCRQLMDSYLIDTCPSARRLEPKTAVAEPQSPIGVLDAATCAGCEMNRSVSFEGSEPAAKRRRLELECTESIDTVYENKVP